MNVLWQLLALAGVLGAGAIGGVFLAFSSFVMPALARLPPREGLAAMQSINVTVIRPSFLGPFVGTAVLSLGGIAVAGLRWSEPGAVFLASGGALYFVGTFLLTGTRNVPLNNSLAKVNPTDARAEEAWGDYLRRWTFWNHVRTAAALIATLSFALVLARQAG